MRPSHGRVDDLAVAVVAATSLGLVIHSRSEKVLDGTFEREPSLVSYFAIPPQGSCGARDFQLRNDLADIVASYGDLFEYLESGPCGTTLERVDVDKDLVKLTRVFDLIVAQGPRFKQLRRAHSHPASVKEMPILFYTLAICTCMQIGLHAWLALATKHILDCMQRVLLLSMGGGPSGHRDRIVGALMDRYSDVDNHIRKCIDVCQRTWSLDVSERCTEMRAIIMAPFALRVQAYEKDTEVVKRRILEFKRWVGVMPSWTAVEAIGVVDEDAKRDEEARRHAERQVAVLNDRARAARATRRDFATVLPVQPEDTGARPTDASVCEKKAPSKSQLRRREKRLEARARVVKRDAAKAREEDETFAKLRRT